MMPHLTRWVVSVSLLAATVNVVARELKGRVVGIADGDTLTLLVGGHEQYKIRLMGIDAPEKRQAFGQRAKEQLAALAYDRCATVEFDKQDRYGRLIGKVRVAGKDVNLGMIEAGLAWHYKQYQSEQTIAERTSYADTESRAHLQQLGLWKDKDPLPPWIFRHSRKQ